MIRTTLKEYLSAPNPTLYLNKKTHHVTYMTESIARELLEGKAGWSDFEVDSIQGLFSTVLSQPFDLPAHPTFPPAQLRVRDERCFESVLLSHNCAIMNAALKAATKFMNLPSVTWLVGSYAEQVIDRKKSFPDWAGISELDPHLNILPGDSKYARQFFDIGEDGKKTKQTDSDDEETSEVFEDDQESSDILEGDDSMSEDDSPDICSPHRSAWTRVSDACLEQVNHYARDCASRYLSRLSRRDYRGKTQDGRVIAGINIPCCNTDTKESRSEGLSAFNTNSAAFWRAITVVAIHRIVSILG